MAVLEPIINHQIEICQNKLITEKIHPWLLNFKNGTLCVSRFDGRKITVGGCIEFSGTAREIFWQNYIEPFLKDFTVTIIKSVEDEGLKSNLNLEDELDYLSVALPKTFNEIYRIMADVDQKLRGNGYPKQVPLRDIRGYLGRMENFLENHICMVMQKNSKNKEYKNYISKIWKDPVWSKVIGTALTGILGYLSWELYNYIIMP